MVKRYNIVRLEKGGEPVLMWPNEVPAEWENAQEAADTAARWNQSSGGRYKYQVRPVKPINPDEWRKRELDRIESGYYTLVPWHKEPWVQEAKECVDHFLHVARDNRTMVAFTADQSKAERDIKTLIRPSTYLARYYGKIISEEVIRQWVASYKKLYDKANCLKFAYTAEEIEHVYRRGPESCMSHALSAYRSPIHPVRVYEGPDLAVAYLQKNGRIIARALCWPKKKIFGRIYGDSHLLECALEDEGFKYGRLEGARFTKVKHNGRYVCPYIDHSKGVKVGKRYLVIADIDRRILDPEQNKRMKAAAGTDGFCGSPPIQCAHCSQYVDPTKLAPRRVDGSFYWCQTCYDTAEAEDRIFLCAYDNTAWQSRSRVVLGTGQTVRAAVANHAELVAQCRECNTQWPISSRMGVQTTTHFMPRRNYAAPWVCRQCGERQRELPLEQAPQHPC